MMNKGAAISEVNIDLELEGDAGALFEYITSWSSYRSIGFPFARFENLPQGRLESGQELDISARAFLFFTQTVYINIIDVDRHRLYWESYTAQNSFPPVLCKGHFSKIGLGRSRLTELGVMETEDESVIDTFKYFRTLQYKRMAKQFLKQRQAET